MKPYFEEKGVTLYQGDCLEVMKSLAESSFDSVVTDPPYELGFMGKGWDRSGIAYDVDVWRECLRVLKPGGHLLAFGGSRTYHRLACAIEDAGFEIRDQIQWLYGSGFPKSLDVSKAIDARPGVTRHAEFAAELRAAMIAKGITNSFDVSETVTGRRTGAVANWLKYQWPEAKWWPALRDALDMGHKWDEVIAEADRDVLGKSDELYGRKSGIANGTELNSTVGGTRVEAYDITVPATEAAKQWNGWGTALKPAHEPIVLARKPLIGTVAENVLQHGTGGLNIDGCRITVTADDDVHAKNPHTKNQAGGWSIGKKHQDLTPYDPAKGRWPANVIHDGSEDVLAGFPETASGSGIKNPVGGVSMWERGSNWRDSGAYEGDSGSAARFFYCAKASKKDRGEGNNHPTVKPTQLMRYLVRLVTPPGGVVLDPFGGSGSTAKACRLEGFNCILIEKELEYCELAVRRASITHPGPCPKYGENRLNQEVLNFEAVA